MTRIEPFIAKLGVNIAENGPIFNFVQGNQNEINISILSLLTVLSALVATTLLHVCGRFVGLVVFSILLAEVLGLFLVVI